MPEQFRIQWHDAHHEPQVAPNPRYPTGVDVDVSAGAVARCKTALPYPARRIGYYEVRCRSCGVHVAITTAGGPDDPRSLTVACKSQEAPHADPLP